MMTTLKQARESGEIDRFVKEHERDPKGDADQVNRTLKAMARTSKEARAASKKGNRDG